MCRVAGRGPLRRSHLRAEAEQGMRILSIKSGDDGALAGVDAARGQLLFLYEAEKDSFLKNAAATAETFLTAGDWFDDLPDILTLTGHAKTGLDYSALTGAGYRGIGPRSQIVGKKNFFGRRVDFYSSTHERAHIWASYALSPLPQNQPCYVLVWDDVLGDFYEVDADLNVHHRGHVADNPAHKFAFLHALADPRAMNGAGARRGGNFGRMMAAAAAGDALSQDPEATSLIARILDRPDEAGRLDKSEFRDSPFFNAGTGSRRFQNLAARFSATLFSLFLEFARRHLDQDYPLLIAGECGLNCDWNTRWRDCGLFPSIFAPPCAGDGGCAIGTAVDAMRHFTGRAKLEWTVYAGQPFRDDASLTGASAPELNLPAVARALADGKIIGWARGNCEIGPRALGNRSILAAPFDPKLRTRLNRIKGRPADAPVAPTCLAEDVPLHFRWTGGSPHMLYFQQVTDSRLQAITHINGSARVQTVSRADNLMLYDLLAEFKRISGVGVLCNTSLNFKGAGFINRTSDLYHFAREFGLDGFLAGIKYYDLSLPCQDEPMENVHACRA